MELKVRTYKIYDRHFDNWDAEVRDRWIYDDFIARPDYAREWISITSLAYHEGSDSVFLGIGSFSKELLWKLDRRTGQITSMGYEDAGDRFDAKLHRSLEIDGDTLYGGPALLHDVDKQFEARGGRVFRYDIGTGRYEFLGLPCPRIYIQSLALDRARRMLYGFGASPEVFWKFDLNTMQGGMVAYIGSGAEFIQSHNPVIDDAGCVWGTYGILRAFAYDVGPDSIRLFRYDPDRDETEFTRTAFPIGPDGEKGIPDNSMKGPDGCLYFGLTRGELIRFDPETRAMKSLYRNPDSRRMAGMAFGPDGYLYCMTGEEYGHVKLICYDTKAEKLLREAPVVTEDGETPMRIHHMICTPDGTLYAGENDNHFRYGYLWEIRLP